MIVPPGGTLKHHNARTTIITHPTPLHSVPPKQHWPIGVSAPMRSAESNLSPRRFESGAAHSQRAHYKLAVERALAEVH
jgi:hypothetical protein